MLRHPRENLAQRQIAIAEFGRRFTPRRDFGQRTLLVRRVAPSFQRPAQDAMIGEGGVRYIRRWRARHVATRAFRDSRMAGRKRWVAGTANRFDLTIPVCVLTVWVVASAAPQLAAA